MKKITRFILLIVLFLPIQSHSIYAVNPEIIVQLEKDIKVIVDELNTHRYALAENGHAIEELEVMMQRNEVESANLSAVIDSRMNQAKERLLELQLNNEQYSVLNLLFTSHSLVDFFERLFLVVQLQEAANEKIIVAQQSKKRLAELKNEHDEQLKELTQRQYTLETQMNAVEQKRMELEKLLVENQEAVAQILAKQERERQLAQHDVDQQVTPQPAQSTTSQNTSTTQQTPQNQQDDASQPIESSTTTSIVTTNNNVETPMLITLAQFRVQGVVFYGGNKFTYYSELVLPGGGLNIPGRHVNANGYVVDGQGYIVLANDAPLGTVIDTPFGAKGKVYDRGTFGNQYDVYIR